MVQDLFDRKLYAKKIAGELDAHYKHELEKPVNRRENMVFAISGKWGEGKTYLLRQLKTHLEEKGFFVILFDPWKYTHEEVAVKRAFLKTLKEKLGSKVDLTDLYHDKGVTEVDKKKLKSVVLAVFKALLVLAFVYFLLLPIIFNSGSIQEWVEYSYEFVLSLIQSGLFLIIIAPLIVTVLLQTVTFSRKQTKISTDDEFEKIFNTTLNNNKKIAILIDNLDRCTSPTIKLVLNSLKTFLEHHECSYVIAGDHTVIEKSIQENSKGKSPLEGRRFLKKLFDVYWKLPLPSPRLFSNFVERRIEESEITFLDDSQKNNLEALLVNDRFFERNPRNVERFIDTIRFQVESLYLQLEDIENTEDNHEERESLKKIVSYPDLLGKVLLIQELVYPIYERLILHPADIIHHEKLYREGKRMSEVDEYKIGGEKISAIDSGLKKEHLEIYIQIIGMEPTFTNEHNTVIHEVSTYFSFSGQTGLPSSRGPDPANFEEYINTGQLVENLGEDLESATPSEKNKYYADRAMGLFDKSEDQEVKFNVVTESFKLARYIPEWKQILPKIVDSYFKLEQAHQIKYLDEAIDILIKEAPELLEKIESTSHFQDSFWQNIKNREKLPEKARHAIKKITTQKITPTTPNIKALEVYATHDKSILDSVRDKLDTPDACLEWLSQIEAAGLENDDLRDTVLGKLRIYIQDYSNIEWVISHKVELQKWGIFDGVKKYTEIDQTDKLIDLLGRRTELDYNDHDVEIIRKKLHKKLEYGEVDFLSNSSLLQDALGKRFAINAFETLVSYFANSELPDDKRESVLRILNHENNIWSIVTLEDIENELTKLKENCKLKPFNKKLTHPWSQTRFSVLESWGYQV